LKFSPPISNAFSLTKQKLPLNEILLLVFKRVLQIEIRSNLLDTNFWKPLLWYIDANEIEFLRGILIPKIVIEEQLRLCFEKFWNWRGGAVLLLWAILSPLLAWIAKNEYFVSEIWALFKFSPPLANNIWVKNYTKVGERCGVTAKGKYDGVEWKPCLRRGLHFPFNIWLSIKYTWRPH
jgi:hypothetical protein